MGFSKKKREAIHAKLDGHCGYCGRVISLKEMQVDHMWPQMVGSWPKPDGNGGFAIAHIDDPDNLMPSCRCCNHYKRSDTVDRFRQSMITLHERLRNIYILKVGEAFGMLEVKPFGGTFYFERLNNGKDQ